VGFDAVCGYAACQDVRLVFKRALEDVGLSLPPLDANHHDSPKAVEDWLPGASKELYINMFGTNKNITTVLSNLQGFLHSNFVPAWFGDKQSSTMLNHQLQENRIPVAEEDPAIEAIEARAPSSSIGTARAPD
jgi:hypothetical protein